MRHPIHHVTKVTVIPPYGLRLEFEDGVWRTVDLEPILRGELFGPLRDPGLFRQVTIDPEARTVVWPNGADLDPATLYDWPACSADLIRLAENWPVTMPGPLALRDAPPQSPCS